jgi:hypothetical protein
MKKVILPIVLLMTSASFAAALSCPTGYTAVQNCKSTPVAGDSVAAANMLDFITVCAQGNRAMLAIEKSGQVDVGPAATTVRAGGTTYTVTTEDIDFHFSVATGVNSKSTEARLTVVVKSAKNLTASSTYTCAR